MLIFSVSGTVLAVIVKASSGPRYVVGCRSSVPKHKLKQGVRVSLDMTTLTIMRVLPREVDPLVYNMSLEDPGSASFAGIGGLGEQIRELREVSEQHKSALVSALRRVQGELYWSEVLPIKEGCFVGDSNGRCVCLSLHLDDCTGAKLRFSSVLEPRRSLALMLWNLRLEPARTFAPIRSDKRRGDRKLFFDVCLK